MGDKNESKEALDIESQEYESKQYEPQEMQFYVRKILGHSTYKKSKVILFLVEWEDSKGSITEYEMNEELFMQHESNMHEIKVTHSTYHIKWCPTFISVDQMVPGCLRLLFRYVRKKKIKIDKYL